MIRRWILVVIAVAALQGGAGVILSAAAAHIESSVNLATASQYLIVHAAAALALAAIAAANSVRARWLAGGVIALQAGVTLFAGDLALRAFTGEKLFPYAAPIGGSLIIASWFAVAAWAIAAAVETKTRGPFAPER